MGVPTPQAVKGFIDEITLLRQLRGKPNIIQLIDAQVRAPPGMILKQLPCLLLMGVSHGSTKLASCGRGPCQCAPKTTFAWHKAWH